MLWFNKNFLITLSNFNSKNIFVGVPVSHLKNADPDINLKKIWIRPQKHAGLKSEHFIFIFNVHITFEKTIFMEWISLIGSMIIYLLVDNGQIPACGVYGGGGRGGRGRRKGGRIQFFNRRRGETFVTAS